MNDLDAYILVPRRWRSTLRWSRLILAGVAPGVAAYSAGPGSRLKAVFLFAYLVYAAILAVSPRQQRLDRASAGYLIDSAYFLLLASCSGLPMGALAALAWLFGAVRAMLYRPCREVLLVGAGTWLAFALIRPAGVPSLGLALAIALAIALAGCRQRELLSERLVEASRQAALYRQETEKARQAERERLAADFHDGPLQSFASFQIRLEIIRKLMEQDPAAAMEELRQLQHLGQAQLEEIRAFVRQMRPVQLDGMTFGSALRRLVESFEGESGLATRLESREPVEVSDAHVAGELLKVVREALHNAHKHARASCVTVWVERSDGELEIAVRDNGAGFPFSGRYELEELDRLGLGPQSIRQRVRALGGELTLESRPGEGAELRVRVRA